MPKEYWFILHWLLERGEVRDRELDLHDRNLLETNRRYGRTTCEDGWWSLTESGHAALNPVNVRRWALAWGTENPRKPIEDMIAYRKAQVQP